MGLEMMTEEEWKRTHPGEPYPFSMSDMGQDAPGLDWSALGHSISDWMFKDRPAEQPEGGSLLDIGQPGPAPRGTINTGVSINGGAPAPWNPMGGTPYPGSGQVSGAVPIPQATGPRTMATAPAPAQPMQATADPFNLRPAPGQTAAPTSPQGLLAAQQYLNAAKGILPDQQQNQNPYFQKASQLADRSQPTKADMLAAFGFGMAAAPTGDPWRAAGIGGMAALSMKQDGMTRYSTAINNLSAQYEANAQHQASLTQNNRIGQLNAALKMQELDQNAKGVPRPGTTLSEQVTEVRQTYQQRRADVIAKADEFTSQESINAKLEQLKKEEEAEIQYITTGTRAVVGPPVADQ